MNDSQRQQVIEQIKSSKHVLVTVSSNPTVDELAASIGLTLAINKMDKHATTVFSGIVPSTIEFLQPEKTIETTTDSLRDFIIALDKSKADKLRYKVEDDVVRIFITPYRTTISDKDLEFSQGDFNVDLVIALGVTRRQDLDQAITSHGRILHDATILALTKREVASDLGSINWQDSQASSLSEMVASVVTEIQPQVIDGQMATAFLTGIIAETDRFKNEKTTPLSLSLSSTLMSAGANQQLIAEKLDELAPAPEFRLEEPDQSQQYSQERVDGELAIDHKEDEIDKIHIDDNGNLNLSELNDDDSLYQSAELPVPVDTNNENNQTEPVEASRSYDYQQTEPQPQVENYNLNPNDDTNDVGKDLFEDLSTQNVTSQDEGPTLKQPNSSATPMMQHGKVIAPPFHSDDLPKSDKPFDPQEAMQEAGVMQQVLPSAPQTPLPQPHVVQTPLPQPQVVQNQLKDNNYNEAPLSQSGRGDSLADLEKAVGSLHVEQSVAQVPQAPIFPAPPPELQAVQDTVLQASTDSSSVPPLFPSPLDTSIDQPISLEAPKVDTGENNEESNDPNAPPPVPPPMSPQFYDADGNNANPFLNPHA